MIEFGVLLFGAATWATTFAFSVLFPAADSLLPGNGVLAYAWIVPSLGILAYAPWLGNSAVASGQEKTAPSAGLLALSLLAQTAFALFCAATLHRDFFSLIFQAFCLHFILFLQAAPRLRSRFFFRYTDRLYSFAKGLVAFFLAWIAMMGYAIAVRSEPRWIPALAYNILNLALCFFLYAAALGLHRKSKRELIVAPDGILLDNLNISLLFNPATIPIARFLVVRRGSDGLTCLAAQRLLGKETDSCDCSKATLCPRYKYLYNRIHELKRIFAALRLGNITDPVKPRNILTEGWRFIPDASVTVIETEDPIDAASAETVHVD